MLLVQQMLLDLISLTINGKIGWKKTKISNEWGDAPKGWYWIWESRDAKTYLQLEGSFRTRIVKIYVVTSRSDRHEMAPADDHLTRALLQAVETAQQSRVVAKYVNQAIQDVSQQAFVNATKGL